MHIRNCHTQKTASPRSKKEEREREHVFIRISISNKTPKKQLTKKRTLGLQPWNGQWQTNLSLGV
jgi:hypothetical protein